MRRTMAVKEEGRVLTGAGLVDGGVDQEPWLRGRRGWMAVLKKGLFQRASPGKGWKSSTADSEHTPHPFYSHLSQSSCVKRRLGHSSSATYDLHFQIDYASNTNPQSGSSYSLRVLKSLHEIFRAPFLILGLKHCQSSSPAWRKLSAKTLA